MISIFSFSPRSRSARDLAEALGCKQIRHHNSKFRGSPHKLVINWGSSYHALPPEVQKCQILNREGSRNKLEVFRLLDGQCSLPDWADAREKGPLKWLQEGSDVVVRHSLRGHSGMGIQIVKPGEMLPLAPLYTRYTKKKREFRVHCFAHRDNMHLYTHEKKGRAGAEKNYQIRNHQNGFVYVRDPVNIPEVVHDEASKAFEVLGLHFGAIDMIYNEHQDKAYVLECNTAPGMDGSTIDMYADYFKEQAKCAVKYVIT